MLDRLKRKTKPLPVPFQLTSAAQAPAFAKPSAPRGALPPAKRVGTALALLCVLLALGPANGLAAGNPPDAAADPSTAATVQSNATRPPVPPEANNWFASRLVPYKSKQVPPISLTNSSRLDALMRAGDLYLSIRDAVALTLENNLDLELQRYGEQIADNNLLHAQAGGFASPVSVAVTAGPGSVTGAPPSAGLQTYLIQPVTQVGFAVPSLDPALIASANWAHQTTPESSSFVSGTASLIQRQDLNNVAFQKYFSTGTLVSLGINNNSIINNSSRAQFEPSTVSNLTLSFTQHLLQGFGRGINDRQIRIAKNNREVSDLTFKAQVIATVTAVMDLYWDLVSYQQVVKVQQDAVATDQRLYENNKKQVEVGTLAPIEVTRAEAQIAADQQALTVAQTNVLQQETILKNALSRNGVQSAVLANAHIIPTDRIQVPDVEAITPIQDSTALALSARPELSQFRILIQNQEIGIKATKNELLPTLDFVANFGNGGLAGSPVACVPTAADPHPKPGTKDCIPPNPLPNPYYEGGYGNVLTQIFSHNFPTYAAGFNLTIPIHNRAAQADMIATQLNLRQQQVYLQKMENQVRVEVQNGVIALQQARAQHQAAMQALRLQQQTVDAEEKKLALGASTVYNVILTQRDMVTAQSNLVAAESAYAKARVETNRATGQTLNDNDISIDEAFRGVVTRPPSPIPDVPGAQTLPH
jgi:outer membrane protein TolC